jgi:hypothetical protein
MTTSMRRRLGLAVIALPLLTAPALAEPVAPAATPWLAAGYKIGNGLGPAGVDLVVQPLPRWGLDVQIARSAIGVDFAPALQYQLDPASGTYVSLGYNRTALEVFGQPLGRNGLFANVGRQWQPWPKVGVIAGVGYHTALPSTDVVFGQTVTSAGWGAVNFEFGLRYYFL